MQSFLAFMYWCIEPNEKKHDWNRNMDISTIEFSKDNPWLYVNQKEKRGLFKKYDKRW